jgi:glucans biosynthesis protein C
VRRWPMGFERIANGAQVALQSGSLLRGLGGPILFLALMRWLLYPRFGSTHALVDDLYNHSIYLPVFLAGTVAATRQDIFQRFATWRWAALVLALLSWTVFTSLQGGQAQIREQLPGLAPTLMAALGPTYALAWASMQWAAVVAALGFARQHLNGEHPWRAPLTEAVFPVYLLHQTLLICLAVWLFPLGWPPAIEGPVIVVLTFTGCLLLWRVTRNVSFLRTPMGIEIKAPSAPAASVIK